MIASGFVTPSFGNVEPFDAKPNLNRTTFFGKVNHKLTANNQLFLSTNFNHRANDSFVPPSGGSAFISPPAGSISLPSTASDIRDTVYSINGRETLPHPESLADRVEPALRPRRLPGEHRARRRRLRRDQLAVVRRRLALLEHELPARRRAEDARSAPRMERGRLLLPRPAQLQGRLPPRSSVGRRFLPDADAEHPRQHGAREPLPGIRDGPDVAEEHERAHPER